MIELAAPRRDVVSRPVRALHQIDAWDVPFAAVGVTRADGVVATRGDTTRAVRLASVSKPVAALATLVAAEEGVVDLDEPAGPPGATVRHLLAHASGLPFEGETPIAPPGRPPHLLERGLPRARRAPRAGARRCRSPTTSALPWSSRSGSRSIRAGHPGAGMHGSLDDVLAVGRELLAPRARRGRDPRRDDERPVPRPRRRSARTSAASARSTGGSASS